MAEKKKLMISDMDFEDIRQINNTLFKDVIASARVTDVGFANTKGKDYIEGGWTRGGDHVKGGWGRGAIIDDFAREVIEAGLQKSMKK